MSRKQRLWWRGLLQGLIPHFRSASSPLSLAQLSHFLQCILCGNQKHSQNNTAIGLQVSRSQTPSLSSHCTVSVLSAPWRFCLPGEAVSMCWVLSTVTGFTNGRMMDCKPPPFPALFPLGKRAPTPGPPSVPRAPSLAQPLTLGSPCAAKRVRRTSTGCTARVATQADRPPHTKCTEKSRGSRTLALCTSLVSISNDRNCKSTGQIY